MVKKSYLKKIRRLMISRILVVMLVVLKINSNFFKHPIYICKNNIVKIKR